MQLIKHFNHNNVTYVKKNKHKNLPYKASFCSKIKMNAMILWIVIVQDNLGKFTIE